MSEIVFEVLCADVLEALRGLGLGKFSIRNYYYEGMRPIIKAYRSEGVIFYSIPFTSEVVDRFRAEHENGLVSDHVWMSIRKVKALFEEYTQTGEIIWQRLKPEPKVCISPYYQEILFGFRKHEANTRSIGYGSLRDEENICRRFFAYLDANGRHNCKDIDLTIVNDFLIVIAPQRKSSIDRVTSTLRHLCEYLLSKKICNDFSTALTARPAPRRKLRPAFSAREVGHLQLSTAPVRASRQQHSVSAPQMQQGMAPLFAPVPASQTR